jgi:hypothetical protein
VAVRRVRRHLRRPPRPRRRDPRHASRKRLSHPDPSQRTRLEAGRRRTRASPIPVGLRIERDPYAPRREPVRTRPDHLAIRTERFRHGDGRTRDSLPDRRPPPRSPTADRRLPSAPPGAMLEADVSARVTHVPASSAWIDRAAVEDRVVSIIQRFARPPPQQRTKAGTTGRAVHLCR